MYRSSIARCLVLLGSLGLAACAAYQSQHAHSSGGAGESAYAAPSEAPGREYTELPTETQLARVRGQVQETKTRLASQGRYACCVEPACNECLLKYGECHCRDAVREEGPCCGECTEAWVEGRGAVEGISAWELLERKKQQLQKQDKSGAPPWETNGEQKQEHQHQEPGHQHHHHP